jgi:hypothetical protein
MMTFSDDGGRTWSNELAAATGAIGEYGTRVKWPPLGGVRNKARIIRFAMSAAVRRGFLQATMRGEALR